MVHGGRVAVSERRPRISAAAQALILGVGMTGVLSVPGLRCGPEGVDGQAAETVVASELDYDEGGFQGDDAIETINTVFRGVSADAIVDDTIAVALSVECGLQVVGVTLAGFGSVSFGQAVAKTDDQRACVRLFRVGCWRDGCVFLGGVELCIAGVRTCI